MSQFIHVDGDDGTITVADEQIEAFAGWVYKVEDTFSHILKPKDLEGYSYLYELLEQLDDVTLVKLWEQ